jgi:hypothetical protein
MRRAIAIVWLFAACSQSAAPAPADLAHTAPPVAAPPVAAPPVAASPPVAPPPGSRPPAEVELRGKYTAPKDAKGPVRIWATDGECWKSGTRSYGEALASNGTFFLEVMVTQGSPIWVCAAAVPPTGPMTIYGGITKPLKGEGQGEVRYNDVAVELQPGKPVTRPQPAPPAHAL